MTKKNKKIQRVPEKILAAAFILNLVAPPAVWADIIEIKGQGIKNGKIVSQDDKEVVFEDADHITTKIPRENVLMTMPEDKPVVKPALDKLVQNIKDKAKIPASKDPKKKPQGTSKPANMLGRLDARARADKMEAQIDAAYNNSPATRKQREVLARMTGRAVGDAQPPKDNSASSNTSFNPSFKKESSSSSGDNSFSRSSMRSLEKDGKEHNYRSL